jgi:hypothetical protein
MTTKQVIGDTAGALIIIALADLLYNNVTSPWIAGGLILASLIGIGFNHWRHELGEG